MAENGGVKNNALVSRGPGRRIEDFRSALDLGLTNRRPVEAS